MPRGLGPRGFLADEEKKNKPKVTKSLLLLALVTLAASQVIGVLESYINAWISQRIILDMKNQMYDHLQHMPHAFFTSEKQGDIITRMNTDISGVSTVVSGTLSSIASNFAAVVTTLVALFSMSWQLAIVGIIVIPLLIYFAGGWLIIARKDQTLTVGAITATVALINRLYRPVRSLLDLQVDFTRSLALFTRIFDYFDMKNNIVSPADGEKPDVADGDICFDHVSFSYSRETPLLEDICFTVPAGKMYALVGPSGSGKSTVVNLIPRLFDVTGGRVTVAGVDVREFDLTRLRQNIGVVSQDTYLFNGTIRESLLYAKEDATQEEQERACRIASIAPPLSGQWICRRARECLV